MNIKKSIIVASLLIAGMGSGCKKFLDINTNPNVAQDVPENMLLTSAEVYIASALGVDMNVNAGLWAQYWTQSPTASQYKIYEQYSPSASDYDRRWGLLYNQALEDLDVLEQKAVASKKKQYVAIAKILKAYAFQLATDAWGDVPFTEALKGTKDEGSIINPKFDAQETVYNGIFNMLDSARALIYELNVFDVQGDLLFGGDQLHWLEFANTLQLRAYLRLSEKNPSLAGVGVTKLYNFVDTSGVGFLDMTAAIEYGSSAGNQNPLYSEMTGLSSTQNIVASATVVDSMISNDDPRRFGLYTVLGSDVVGIRQGAYNLPASTQVSIPLAITGAAARDANSALAPVIFLSSWESHFLQAEAIARFGVTGSDLDEFEAGIEESMSFLNVDAADAAAYLTSYWGSYPAGGTTEEKLEHILTQKWFSMAGLQNFEAWTEQRRSGYPDFFVTSANSIIGTGKFPAAFLYPNSEVTRNSSFPGQRTIDARVWWDTF